MNERTRHSIYEAQTVKSTKVETGIATFTREPVFEVRAEVALQDRTPFELALTLRANGFQWQLMPVKKADRKQLHYVIDDQQQPRMWYTLSSCLVPQYMLCLLKASEVNHLHGIERFPHYSPKPIWDYGQILEKEVVFEHKPDSPRPALCNDDAEVEAESVEGAAEQLLSLEDMYGAVAEEEETLE